MSNTHPQCPECQNRDGKAHDSLDFYGCMECGATFRWTPIPGISLNEESEGNPSSILELSAYGEDKRVKKTRITIETPTELGYGGTSVDLILLVAWLRKNRPDLLRKQKG